VASPGPAWGDLGELLPQPWAQIVDAATRESIQAMGTILSRQAQSEIVVPPPVDVFRALQVAPRDVRVLIVGQDPYPTPGHAMGLSFSLPQGTQPLPPSAKNILIELESDVAITAGTTFDLTSWAQQGVLLLNRHLTTTAHSPGAHASLGWQSVTDALITGLVSVNHRFVAILWGRQAQQLSALLGKVPIIESAHPSPLSATRGFFGSQPFSRANRELEKMGLKPIDWSLR
jgi:uracil-DNA glycosylase